MSFQGLRTHLVYLSLRLFKLRLLSMKKYFIIIITIFIYSCERDSSSQSSGEQLIPGRKIYIAGSSYNSSGDMTGCYWVDGVRNELSGGAWATDITVSNGDVYISGTSENYNACYWINQKRYDLPGQGGEAEAIAVYEDDIYVAG